MTKQTVRPIVHSKLAFECICQHSLWMNAPDLCKCTRCTRHTQLSWRIHRNRIAGSAIAMHSSVQCAACSRQRAAGSGQLHAASACGKLCHWVSELAALWNLQRAANCCTASASVCAWPGLSRWTKVLPRWRCKASDTPCPLRTPHAPTHRPCHRDEVYWSPTAVAAVFPIGQNGQLTYLMLGAGSVRLGAWGMRHAASDNKNNASRVLSTITGLANTLAFVCVPAYVCVCVAATYPHCCNLVACWLRRSVWRGSRAWQSVSSLSGSDCSEFNWASTARRAHTLWKAKRSPVSAKYS